MTIHESRCRFYVELQFRRYLRQFVTSSHHPIPRRLTQRDDDKPLTPGMASGKTNALLEVAHNFGTSWHSLPRPAVNDRIYQAINTSSTLHCRWRRPAKENGENKPWWWRWRRWRSTKRKTKVVEAHENIKTNN